VNVKLKPFSAFLDEEADVTVFFLLPKVLMASTIAPAGDIVPGAGISTLNMQDVSGSDLANFFFGAEQRHGAAESTGIEYGFYIQAFRGDFDVAHGILLRIDEKKLMKKNGPTLKVQLTV
jgi:hypothetical protein